MGTLFIDRKDCQIDLQQGVLVLRVPGQRPEHVPAALLQQVVIRSQASISSRALTGLATAGVGTLVVGGRRGERLASLVGAQTRDVRLRITQVRRLEDREFIDAWCRALIRARIRGQARLLQKALEERPALRRPLTGALHTLHQCKGRLRQTAGPERLRGLEGAAAASFFKAYAQLFAASLGFPGRRRRPPPDPVNACLSLGYTLLHGAAVQACHVQGLDPMLGYLHSPAHARASLASDLVEPWRAGVETLVWNLFRKQALTADHFSHESHGACLLNKAGRSIFYAHWAAGQHGRLRALRRHARLVTRALGDLTADLDACVEGHAWD